jgi:hypothetical protein
VIRLHINPQLKVPKTKSGRRSVGLPHVMTGMQDEATDKVDDVLTRPAKKTATGGTVAVERGAEMSEMKNTSTEVKAS